MKFMDQKKNPWSNTQCTAAVPEDNGGDDGDSHLLDKPSTHCLTHARCYSWSFCSSCLSVLMTTSASRHHGPHFKDEDLDDQETSETPGSHNQEETDWLGCRGCWLLSLGWSSSLPHKLKKMTKCPEEVVEPKRQSCLYHLGLLDTKSQDESHRLGEIPLFLVDFKAY